MVENSLRAKNQINPFIPFDRTPTSDRQTQTDGHRAIASTRAASMASRGKKMYGCVCLEAWALVVVAHRSTMRLGTPVLSTRHDGVTHIAYILISFPQCPLTSPNFTSAARAQT